MMIVRPAGIPAPVVKKLNEEFIRAAHSEAVTHVLVSQATEGLHHHAARVQRPDGTRHRAPWQGGEGIGREGGVIRHNEGDRTIKTCSDAGMALPSVR